jgi:hypothetical protein
VEPGKHVFYQLQHRKTHESPWLKPKGKLKPVENRDWAFSSWDYFGGKAEPWAGRGNGYKPKYPEAHEETHEVWARTGYHGWWTLEYALKALARVTKAQAEGAFDSRGSYKEHCQALRYEFRIVKVSIEYSVEALTGGVLANAYA